MALTERLQLLIESTGGAAMAAELEKIGVTGEAAFEGIASAGTLAITQQKALGAEAAVTGRQVAAGYEVATKGAESYAAAVTEAAAVERTAAERAEANVAKKVAANAALQEQAAAYKAIALASEEGSAQQVAANRLLEVSNKKLAASGLEVAGAEEVETAASRKLSAALEEQALAGKGAAGILSTGISSIKTAISELPPAAKGIGVLGVAIAGLAAEGVKHFQSLAGEIRAFDRLTGTSAETGSRFVYALHQLGIEPEAAGKALGILSRNLIDHADKAEKAGVEIAHLKNGQVDLIGSLLNVGDAYKAAGAGAEGNALAAALLGKGYQTLLPLLGKTREELQGLFADAGKHGLVFNQRDLDQAKEFTIAQRQAHAAVEGLEIQLGKGLLPVLTSTTTGFAHLVDGVDRVTKPIGGLAGLIENTGKSMFPLLGIFDLFSSKGKDNVKVTQEQAAAYALDKAALSELGIETDDAEDSTQKLSAAHGKAAEEAKKHAEVIAGLAKQVGLTSGAFKAAFGEEEEAAKSATQAITSAVSGTRSALERDFDAIAHVSASGLDKLQKESDQSAVKIASAEDKLATAQQNLIDVQAKLRASTSISVSDSQALERAQDNLTKTLGDAKSTTDQVAAARKNLADVEERVSAKTNLSISDQIALRKAQDGVTKATEELTVARSTAVGSLGTLTEELKKFYGGAIAEAQTFATGINTAIAKGYDPQFVARLLQEGPKEAAPILEAIASDHDGTLRELVNKSEAAIKDISATIVEQARLTNLAVNAKTDELRRDLPTAMRLVQEQFRLGGEASVEVLAEALGKSVPEARRVAEEFGITFRNTATPAVGTTTAAIDELVVQMGAARVRAQEYDGDIDRIERRGAVTTRFNADTDEAMRRLQEYNDTIERIESRRGAVSYSPPAPSAPSESGPSESAPSGGGESQSTFIDYGQHEGSVLRFFGKGGMEHHVAQFAPAGAMRVWAEPETGGEAYIPMAPSKRDRSTAILAAVADDFNMQLVRKLSAGGVVRFAEGAISEDDPGWDWRTMGDGTRGVYVDGEGWKLQDAAGNLSPHPYPPTGTPNKDNMVLEGGVWVPAETAAYPVVRSSAGQSSPASQTRILSAGESGAYGSGRMSTPVVAYGAAAASPNLRSSPGGASIPAGGLSDDFIERLAAAIIRAVGERQIGPFIINGVPAGDIAEAIPREVRRELYLAGR